MVMRFDAVQDSHSTGDESTIFYVDNLVTQVNPRWLGRNYIQVSYSEFQTGVYSV